MILSKQRSDKSDVKMNGIVIEEKQSFRYLGVQIDSKRSFIDHITKIENKLSMFCGMYYRLRKVLGKDQLLKAYNAYVKPILQYGVLAYASTDQTKLETIELEIKRLLKIIFFKRRNESIEELRQKRKIYFVKELHIYELLKLLCKVLRKECISTIVQEAVTEKNLNTILNKRVLARQIPVQSKGNQKTSVNVRIRKLFNFVLKYYPDFVTKIQSCTQYQLQIFNHFFPLQIIKFYFGSLINCRYLKITEVIAESEAPENGLHSSTAFSQ